MRVSGLVISESILAPTGRFGDIRRATVAKMPIVVVGLEISLIACCIRCAAHSAILVCPTNQRSFYSIEEELGSGRRIGVRVDLTDALTPLSGRPSRAALWQGHHTT